MKVDRNQKVKVSMVLLMFCCGAALADTYYVDLNNATPSAPYTSWATAANHIQAAVDQAVDGDAVLVADGVYYPTAEISIANAITLKSVNGAHSTIIDGVNSQTGPSYEGGRCLNLHNSACVVSGFTIRNADFNKTGSNGGGIGCTGENPLVSDCIIHNNYCRWAGAGIYQGTVVNSIFYSNVSSESGGAAASSTLKNCLFYSNSAANGGAASRSRLINCTVTGNSGYFKGGGVLSSDVSNSIVYYNSCNTTWRDPDIEESELEFSCSPSLLAGVNGNITNAPVFVDRLNKDYRLDAGSPCIDIGDNDILDGSKDMVGNPRVVNNDVDMGAYEYTPYTAMLAASVPHIKEACQLGFSVPPGEFFMWSVGAPIVDYQVGCNVAWLSASPSVGTNTGEEDDISLTYDTDSLPVGIHTAQVSMVSADVENSPVTFDVIVRVYPSSVYVDAETGDDANDGLAWDRAKATIQAGVDELNNEGTVYIAEGTYSITSTVSVLKDIKLEGVDGASATVVDAGQNCGCFNVGNSYSELSGLKMINGWTATGGGVNCSGLNPVITNCIIEGNNGYGSAGGVYKGRVFDSKIVGNQSSNGGGGGLHGSHAVNCLIDDNESRFTGGGVCSGVISNCVVSGNRYTSRSEGGGIYDTVAYNCSITNNQGTYETIYSRGGGACVSTLYNCDISHNDGFYGGGTRNCKIYNSLISHNVSGNGGGMYGGIAVNCTIVSNQAWGGNCYGGGMFGGVATNCIVYDNWSGYNDDDNLEGGALFNSCCPNVAHGVDGNITNVPSFVSAAQADYHLKDASACVNAGATASVVGQTDLDGRPRVSGGSVDMGGYENGPDALKLQIAAGQAMLSWIPVPGTCSYELYWSTDLANDPFVPVDGAVLSAEGACTNSLPQGKSKVFYKLVRIYPE